jgi:translocator protein
MSSVLRVAIGALLVLHSSGYVRSGLRSAPTVGIAHVTSSISLPRAHQSGPSLSNSANRGEGSSTSLNLFFKKRWTPGKTVASQKTFDVKATFSYLAATTLQWTLIAGFLHFLQLKALPIISGLATKVLPVITKAQVTDIIVGFVFFFLSVKSRVFSPLDNRRPRANKDDPVFKNRLRPSWQPPPVAFPIIWTTIAFLRTFAALTIFRTTATLLSYPLFAFVAHLSIGDTWNTVNNVENRLGTSFLGSLFVLGSVYGTTYLYYLTNPLAAKLLAPSAVWLTIACYLIYSIWRLNYAFALRPSLFPSVEEGPPSKWRLPFTSLGK